MQKNQAVKLNEDAYNKIADDFLLKREYRIDELKFLRKFLKKGDRVLDVGCGWGRLLVAFGGINIKYAGVDQSSALLKIAKKKFHGVTFKKAQMTKLPFEDRKFDKIFCIAAFHHLATAEERLQSLREMKRVVKSGGKILLVNWNLLGKWGTGKVEKGDYKRFGNDFSVPWKNSAGLILGERFYHAFTLDEIELLCKGVRLRVEQNLYSKKGQVSDKENGENIVTILSY